MHLVTCMPDHVCTPLQDLSVDSSGVLKVAGTGKDVKTANTEARDLTFRKCPRLTDAHAPPVRSSVSSAVC